MLWTNALSTNSRTRLIFSPPSTSCIHIREHVLVRTARCEYIAAGDAVAHNGLPSARKAPLAFKFVCTPIMISARSKNTRVIEGLCPA